MVQLFRTLGEIAGLAGLAVGLILVLYREIINKVAPTLAPKDGYRLLRAIAYLSFGIAVLGILCWTWSLTISHRTGASDTGAPEESLVVAGTVVDQATDVGIGQATITIDGKSDSAVSEDSGNFRLVFTEQKGTPVRLSVTKEGYFKVDQSVTPPTHDLIIQMRQKTR
jgi:hypothetical protein